MVLDHHGGVGLLNKTKLIVVMIEGNVVVKEQGLSEDDLIFGLIIY
jgi:hypothetical protein